MKQTVDDAIVLAYKEACRLYSEEVYASSPPALSVESPFLAAAHAIRTAWPEVIIKARTLSNHNVCSSVDANGVVYLAAAKPTYPSTDPTLRVQSDIQ